MTQAIETILGGIVSGSLFALVALGFSLVFRVTGVLNLAQGAFVVLGVLTAYTFSVQVGWPLPLAVLATILVAIGIGAAVELVLLRRAVARRPTSAVLILTAGLLTVFQGAALLIWGSQPYALPPFSGSAPIALGQVSLSRQALWVIGSALVLLVATWYLLARTTVGKGLRACAENPTAASLVGVDVPRVRVLAYSAGAAIGALGGVVAGPLISISFDSGSFFTNTGFIAVALGGMGSFVGAIVGGLAVGLLQQIAAGYISSLFSATVAFALLLFVLVVRPRGLLGRGPGREDAPSSAAAQAGSRAALHLTGRSTWLVWLAGLGIVAVMPLWLEPSGLTASAVIAGILFIAVLGLDLLMGYTGQVSLGQAGFMATGAYAAGILATRYHVAPVIGLLVGLLCSLAIAMVLALITGRLRGLYLALATLGFGLLVDSLTIGLSDLTGGPSGLVGIPSFSLGYVFTSAVSNYYLVCGLAAVLLWLSANLTRTGYGRALQAIRADETAARALGIAVPFYKISAFLLSAAFASLAGSLYAFNFHFISPDLVSTARSLELVTMLVVGGEATLIGPLLGAALITALPAVSQGFALYKTLAEGCLLVLILLYLPGGLLGGLARLLQLLIPTSPGRPLTAAATREP